MDTVQVRINEEGTLRSLINGTQSDRYPLLQGLSFRVRIGGETGRHEVSLIE